MPNVILCQSLVVSKAHADATCNTSWAGIGVGVDFCRYLRRRIRRVCPGYYPLERPARLSISAYIRLEFELGLIGVLDEASAQSSSAAPDTKVVEVGEGRDGGRV